MISFERKGTGANRLAETLKKCGIASNVTDAHRLAGDIRNTEKKVQNFFDEKKKEIHEDFIQKVHPNRFDSAHPKEGTGQNMIRQAAISQSQAQTRSTKQSTDFKNDTVKEMIDRAKNPSPLKIQIEFETPKANMEAPKSVPNNTVESKIAPKKIEPIIESKPQIVQTQKAEPVIVNDFKLSEELMIPGEDYISKFMKNEKEEILAVEKEEKIEKLEKIKAQVQDIKPEIRIDSKHEEIKPAKSEPKVDLGIFFGAKKSEEKPHPEATSVSAPIQAHAEPQASKPQPAVDIHNFFNFAKKGKV